MTQVSESERLRELDIDVLAEAIHVVRNHAFDGSQGMHPSDHQLGGGIQDEAGDIATEYRRLIAILEGWEDSHVGK